MITTTSRLAFLDKYSNKRLIIGIYILTFILLYLLGVDGYHIGEIVGAYIQVSGMNIIFMMIPAFPLAVYSRLKNKTFFLSKEMIKASFLIGLTLTVLFILFSGQISFNFGHILAPTCLAIYFFRNKENKIAGVTATDKAIAEKNPQKINFKRILLIVCVFFALFIALLIFIFFQENAGYEPVASKTTSKCYVVPTPRPWDCTSDCSGHKAGYNWAKQKGARTPLDCTGNSNSFIEGCEYYVQEMEHQTTLESCIDSYENAQYE